MQLSNDVALHGGQLRQLSARFGIPASELMDFSASINPDGPPPSVIHALRATLENPALLSSYPDLEERQLKAALALYAGVAPDNIAVANGFVPLLDAALRTLHPRRCLVPVPAFNEYRPALERIDVEATPYILSSETGFAYDVQSLVNALIAGHHDAILLANPQNPSGALCERGQLVALVRAAAERNLYVLLDEAFIDYEPAHSITNEISNLHNIIIFRSVTKFFGMPGIRVAYAVSSPTTIRSLSRNIPPWPVTTLAAVATCAAVEDTEFATRTLLINDQRRSDLIARMQTLGVHAYTPSANFLLLQSARFGDAQAMWHRLIQEHQIVLRDCTHFEGLPPHHFRCAIRDDAQNLRIIAALQALL